MKYNLSDILNDIDVQETEAIIDTIKIDYNETIAQRIKEKVITEEEKGSKHSKLKRLSFKTIIAFAAVVAIILCSITAGAAINFDLNKTFSRVFNGKNIDLNAIASDVNVVSEYNGYAFKLTQVICDGRTIYCAFDCPTENGEMLVPSNGADVNITINGKEPNSYSNGFHVFNEICYLEFKTCEEEHIKSNSKIHLDFNKIDNNRILNREDVAEKLLESGKATQAEVDEALNNSENDLAIYELADARLENTPVSVDGEWSFDFKVGDTDVIRTIDADKVYPYDENNYIEISPLGVHVLSFNPYTMPPMDYEHIFYIEMQDGTIYTEKDTVEIENGYHDGVSSFGYSDYEKNEYRFFTYLALAEFINPDEVKSVSYYDTVIYEAQP